MTLSVGLLIYAVLPLAALILFGIINSFGSAFVATGRFIRDLWGGFWYFYWNVLHCLFTGDEALPPVSTPSIGHIIGFISGIAVAGIYILAGACLFWAVLKEIL